MGNADRRTPQARLRDKDLVVRFKGGDGTAYAAIDRAYRPVAERICRRILINPLDAEDAIQETMMRVLTGLGRFNGQYRLEGWVARIATNVSLDIVRARSRRPETLFPVEEHPVDGRLHAGGSIVRLDDAVAPPEDLVVAAEERKQVRELLGDLPESHREALVLREFEDQSHEQIAQALGTTPPKVKALLHRARRSLARAWDGTSEPRRVGAWLLFPVAAAGRAVAALRRLSNAPSDIIEGGAGQVAAGTAAGAVQAVHIAASPAVSAVVGGGGGSAVANVTALVVAGALGMGTVATVAPSRPDPARVEAVEAAVSPVAAPDVVIVDSPAASPEITASVGPASPVPLGGESGATSPAPGDAPGRPSDGGSPKAAPTSSAPEHSTSPSTAPSTKPSTSPSPSAEPTPTATPMPPAPGYGIAMRSSLSSSRPCGCAGEERLISSTTSGTAGRHATYRQKAQAPLYGADGSAGWRAAIEYWGDLGSQSGSITFDLVVRTAEGEFVYRGTGSVVRVARSADGDLTYTLAGRYRRNGGPATEARLPREGSFTAVLDWWRDGTSLYRADLTLQED